VETGGNARAEPGHEGELDRGDRWQNLIRPWPLIWVKMIGADCVRV
jgi:hypothetical protein